MIFSSLFQSTTRDCLVRDALIIPNFPAPFQTGGQKKAISPAGLAILLTFF
jgi:hypothetical protein